MWQLPAVGSFPKGIYLGFLGVVQIMSLKITLSFESHFLLSCIFMIHKFIIGNCSSECDLKTVFRPGLKSSIGSKPIPSLASCVNAVNRHARNEANGQKQ